MAVLVTVEQVNNALRLGLDLDLAPSAGDETSTERLDDITLKIQQAQDICLDFITYEDKGDWTAETVPGRVTAAIIIAVRCLLDDTPESLAILTGLTGTQAPTMSNPIAALLWRLRTPSLA